MNLRKTIERYADAVSYFDHFAGNEAISAEAAKEVAALQYRIGVLIARAEAAERLAEAFEAAYAIGEHSADDGLLDAAYKQYAAAREAVRKLEEGT